MSALAIDRIEQAAIAKVAAEPEERESFWRHLDPQQSLDMERSHLWVRVAIFILPLVLLLIFGRAALTAAIVCAVLVFGSWALIWSLLRWWPDAISHGQIWLRLLDIVLLLVGISQVQMVLLRRTGSMTDVFDMLYVLVVMSGVGNTGLRGGFALTGAGAVAILIDRLALIRLGLLEVQAQTPGQLALSLVTYIFMFAVTSSTVFYLMQVSAMLAARRERALSAVIAADNVQLEQANEVLRARRRMTADIAHELRNPLTTISGYIEAIRDGELSATPARMDAMHRQAQWLERMIGDLRTLSLADVGALTLTSEPLRVEELVRGTAETYAVRAKERDIDLTWSAEGDLPDMTGDQVRLGQVLGNLVSNALRHTPAGGRVRVVGEGQRGGLQLRVEDTGEGISAEELPLIFDRLYRAGANNQRDETSSGLGLAIVKAIVTAHGGDIAVASTPGVGTTFTIHLPILAPAADGAGALNP
ncbi:MAG TPA: HAMP domain-containing sensor histidine kinase [Chloroflexota bacterium]|nr:HAMP domain-containing sensor histidine kinase [Chloroflexota bacterium]